MPTMMSPPVSQSLSRDNPSALRAARAPGAILMLLVALLAIGVYFNSLQNGFALDDTAIVQGNPTVVGLEWEKIWTQNYWPVTETPPDILYRPLTVWTYTVNEALAPGATWAYHAVNVALHALVTVMTMLLAWRIFRSRAVSIVTGILFAVHPIHTEAVANTVGRAELLAAVWSLAALLIYLPVSDAEQPRRAWHGWLVAACFFLALLCKETPAALVGAIAFFDLWQWLQLPAHERPRFWKVLGRQSLRYYLPLAVAFVLYMAMRIHATGLSMDIKAMHPVINPLINATVIERLLTPFLLLAKYFGLMAWPASLSADYSAPSIMPTSNPLQPLVAAGLLITSLGLLVSVRFFRRAPRIALLVGFFICSYALVSNFMRIGTIMGERLFYWPSVFVIILAAAGMIWAWKWLSAQPRSRLLQGVAAALLVTAVVGMSWRTVVRNTDWKDNIPLAIATARDNPGSAKACTWAGTILVTQTSDKRMNDFGEELLQRAIELYPTYGQSYWELAKYYGRQDKFGRSVIYLAQDARWRGGYRDTRIALTAVKDDLKLRAPETYLPEIEKNLKDHPEDPAAFLAVGLAYAALDRNVEAVHMYEQAIMRERVFDEAAAELGQLRIDQGQVPEGLTLLRTYVTRVPRSLEARCLIAQDLIKLDTTKYPWALGEAEMNLGKAAAISADSPQVRTLRTELARRKAEAVGTGKKSVTDENRLAAGGA